MQRWLRSARGTLLTLFVRLPAAAVGRARRTSWRVRLLAGLVLAVALPAVGYALLQRHRENRRKQQLAATWQEFDYHLSRFDGPATRAALEKLRELDPGNPGVRRRLDNLAAGAADPDDQPLIRLLINEHISGNRLEEAAREARKRVAAEPRDWQARCVLAHDALRRRQPDEAREHLEALPPPSDPHQPIGPGSVLYALRLRRELNLDTADLVATLVDRALPQFKKAAISALKPAEKLQFLECYQQTFQALDTAPTVPTYWVTAAKLAREVLDDPAATAAELVWLGRVEEQQTGALRELVRRRLVSEAEAQDLGRELEGRIRQTWERARAADPVNPTAYIGLALSHARAEQWEEALQVLDEGVRRCGDPAALLAVQGKLLSQADPALGLARVEEAAARRPDDLPVWQLVAESALAAGRFDKALTACRQAQRLRPGLPWACRLEARLRLDQGRPAEALAALEPLRPTMAQDGAGLALAVRALYELKRGPEAAPLVEAAFQPDRPVLVPLEVAAGLLAARQFEPAARAAAEVTRRDPGLAEGWFARAEALRQLAEAGGDELAVRQRRRAAAEAYEETLRRRPGHREAVRQLVWLYAKVLNDPQAAYRTAEPLRALEAEGTLPPELLETLAIAYLGADQPEAARRLLERAERWAAERPDAAAAPGERASYAVHLAQAYHKLSRAQDARDAFERAARLPKSPRVAADWLATQQLLRGTP
jgi:tetratricopeptide (TPR) repeat protein